MAWAEYRILFGTESTLHLEMKAAVAGRLRVEGFGVLLEPPFPPLRGLWWSRYRPDLFGFKRDKTHLEYVFVECETNPASQRILRKRIDSVGWQSLLLEAMRVRFLLVIPCGRLSQVCAPQIRRVWDVWTYEDLSGRVQVYPRLAAG